MCCGVSLIVPSWTCMCCMRWLCNDSVWRGWSGIGMKLELQNWRKASGISVYAYYVHWAGCIVHVHMAQVCHRVKLECVLHPISSWKGCLVSSFCSAASLGIFVSFMYVHVTGRPSEVSCVLCMVHCSIMSVSVAVLNIGCHVAIIQLFQYLTGTDCNLMILQVWCPAT